MSKKLKDSEPVPVASDSDILASLGTDAEKWAAAFINHNTIPDAVDILDFRATLIAWFANAISAGQSTVPPEWNFGNDAPGDMDTKVVVTGETMAALWNGGKDAAIANMATLPDDVSQVGPGVTYKIDGSSYLALVDAHKAHGREDHLRAGLNDTGDVPMLTLIGNAVEFVVVTDNDKRIASVNVDGRTRVIIDDVGIVVLIDNGNRHVVKDGGTPVKVDEAAQFAGYLTTLPTVIKVGASEEVYPMMEALKAYKMLSAVYVKP